MQPEHPLYSVYRAAGIPLWVSPGEARGLICHNGYANVIADELADWMARRLSMSFAAGFLGREEPVVAIEDLVRQLKKMGYAEARAAELAGMIVNNVPALYRKGMTRRGMSLQ